MINKKITIIWEGFPVCGLRVNALIDYFEKIKLYVTKPKVPFNSIYQRLSFKPIDISTETGWHNFQNDLYDTDLVIITGWANKNWLNTVKRAKKQNKSLKICLAVDNNLRYSIRQRLGKYYFRYFILPYVDFYFAAGKSTIDLLCYFGVSSANIFLGYYGAQSDIFFNLGFKKRKGFVFLGQKIKRKGIGTLLSAYDIYNKSGGKEPLYLVGGKEIGNIKDLTNHGISKTGFLQPHESNFILNKSRTLILPSIIEHWGTVVCEAAATGCALLLSDQVGSRYDLLMNGVNGMEFSAKNPEELASLMLQLDRLNESWYNESSRVSMEFASCFSENSYRSSILNMVKK